MEHSCIQESKIRTLCKDAAVQQEKTERLAKTDIPDLKKDYENLHDQIYVGEESIEGRLVSVTQIAASIKPMIRNIMWLISVLITIETLLIGGIYTELSNHIRSESQINKQVTVEKPRLSFFENIANAKEVDKNGNPKADKNKNPW